MQREMPGRSYMEGVSEQYCVGMAAGMASLDTIPFVQTIATFLVDRAREQIRNDVCHHNLPVRLVGNGAGFAYSTLGFTHQAVDDIASMRLLPNMTVVAPCDAEEMARVVEASIDWPGPMYIRMARGGEPIVFKPPNIFEIGKAIALDRRRGVDVAILSTGAMTYECVKAAATLKQISCAVTHFHTIKPLDRDAIRRVAYDAAIVTVEEGTKTGGFGSAVADCLIEEGLDPPILRLGIPDNPPHDYGTRENLLEQCGLLPEQIVAEIRKALG